jgi:hypothetical protein
MKRKIASIFKKKKGKTSIISIDLLSFFVKNKKSQLFLSGKQEYFLYTIKSTKP